MWNLSSIDLQRYKSCLYNLGDLQIIEQWNSYQIHFSGSLLENIPQIVHDRGINKQHEACHEYF